MGGHSFTFKQFHIEQDRCAMKVGTDSIVLGCWTPVGGAKRILDIGTGTGILALMLAQRTHQEVQIDAVELDPEAVRQAEENINASPWRERIRVFRHDIRTYQAPHYDLIISNPPYFVHGQSLPDAARQLARHTEALDHASLLESAARLLTPFGKLALVLPVAQGDALIALAMQQGWHLQQRCWVETKRGKEPNLMLLLLSRKSVETEEEQLCLREIDNRYSPEFIALADEFYLRMSA
ncbi:tRNA1(Val) (adenine(37)-N6)-methyltransferase [Tolumonas lignilytica]|jgi:Predicted O-methyltransferase|uniref:tRNA1(Val) (adenine(37)-N6)-methyltransferase n=1 Tax=Tolumonas lignilytica TaxID=1283284 RepID=UPI000464828C|nr:tRNA1(Val) (adenine(37)-N6)-methyltransferase [Tolumonas lignilytica]